MVRLNVLRTTLTTALVIGVMGFGQPTSAQDDAIERLVPRIISTRPHDPLAFTEGLLLVDGTLYESTGTHGNSLSSMREVDPLTGEVQKIFELRREIFGEGIALVGDRMIQLTWLNKGRIEYNPSTFEIIGAYPYDDEGWGMCYDGEHLFTSNGSAQITQRDAETLEEITKIDVTLDGESIDQINELECVGDVIYANVWHTENILRIDKASGDVTGLIDASGMLTAEQRQQLPDAEAVLNGIAYDADNDTFLLTGKEWSWLFEVEFVPADGADATLETTAEATPEATIEVTPEATPEVSG